ncbi:hypothetical protein Srubr_29510 [Streptomyces rubradiris]|uniref:Uncharacterized protein n=1 Tax=Streptomyces rubradiris TaxID=285531 RepID=A0ABQ3RB71_STRRR|nr:hypothetical protein GCM10018792_52390 [Streptomyces rubradiris]GHI53105.1 hypothetical protein Srubr_29510 [Streptomyces rubradiris]
MPSAVERAIADRQAASGACWSVNPTVSALLPACTREWYAGGTTERARHPGATPSTGVAARSPNYAAVRVSRRAPGGLRRGRCS